MKKTFLAAALLAGSVSFASLSGAAELQVGVAGPMTGNYASFGEQLRRGAEQFVKDQNAKGGINGQKISLNVGDDACDPKQAVAAANDFVSKKVTFVAGHFCSGSSIPASDVYKEEGILQISPASTNPTLTDRGYKNVFRVCGRDDQQGQVAGKFLATHYKGKNVAFIHDKSTYGKGLADQTLEALKKDGGKETVYEAITAGDKDFTALISKLKSEKIDVIYFGGYHTEAGLLVRQARDQGLKAQFLSGDALNSAEFWSIAGPAGEGFMFTFAPDPRDIPANKSLVEKFKAAGYDPEGYTLYTYAALQVYAEAAAKAKSTKLADLEKELRSATFDTAVGKIGFDAKGDVKGPTYVFYKWSNGNYKQTS